MVKQLKDLMHDETVSPPAAGFGPDELIARGRTAVRRRRQTWVAAAAAVVVVAGGTTLALTRDGSREPAPVTPPDAPVVELDDARPAVAGRDYEVLSTLSVQDYDSNRSLIPRGILADAEGTLVVSRARTFAPSREWLLSSPDGELPLGAPPLNHQLDYLGQAPWGDLVFEGEGTRNSITLHTYALATQDWSEPIVIDTSVPNATDTGSVSYLAQGFVPGAGRLWVAVDLPDGSAALWSTAQASSNWRREATVTEFDVSDTLLAYVDAATGDVVQRDLATGVEISTTLPDRGTCSVPDLTASRDQVAALSACDGEGRPFRVDVIDAEGEIVLTVPLRHTVAMLRLSEPFLTLQVVDRPLSTYAVDLRTREPLLLATGWVDRCCAANSTLLAWSSSASDFAGSAEATYTFARLR